MNRLELNPCPPAPSAPIVERLALTAGELADALGVSVRTIMALVAEGSIPFTRIGQRNLRFNLSAIRVWLDGQTTRPAAAVPIGAEQVAGFSAISGANGHGSAARAANGQRGGAL